MNDGRWEKAVTTKGIAILNDEWYRDEGCDLHPSCLSCPLPACRYDLPPKQAQAWARALRLRPLLEQGLTVEQAAAALGVSRRTVFRLKPLLKQLAQPS